MKRIGQFEVIRELGEGGMGVVFLCRDPILGREVAVKMVKGASERQRARFIREAKAIAILRHPGVVDVYSYGEHEGNPYLVMEYLAGKSLVELLRSEGPLDPRRATRILAELTATVVQVHGRGILHRDIKPENVILTDRGPLKLIDFGLCKQEGDLNLTVKLSGIGSPGYMPPEQINDAMNADTLSDVFGLGSTFYALLTGHPPFQGRTAEDILSATLRGNPPPPSTTRLELDPSLDAICSRCLQSNPQHRYPTAQALLEDLQRVLNGERILATPTPAAEPTTPGPITVAQAFGELMDVGFDDESDEAESLSYSPSQLALVGDTYIDAGDYKAAIDSYSRALSTRDDPKVRMKLAYALRRDGNPLDSIDEYDQVIACRPNEYRAHVGRGSARTDLKDFAGAVLDFRHALEILPQGHRRAKRITAALISASKRVGETVIRRSASGDLGGRRVRLRKPR